MSNLDPEDMNAVELLQYMSHKPHDAAFKLLMKRKDISIPYLKSKFPISLSKRCHWDQLELQPTEFLDEQFTERISDLLFKIPYGKDQHCYIYLLFESQRTHDRTMPWRSLKYMVEIWKDIEQERLSQRRQQQKREEECKENKEEFKEEKIKIFPLPSIFPLVYYNGKEKWTTPLSFTKSGLIDIPPGMMPFTPSFQYELTDLYRMQQEDFNQYKSHKHTYHIMRIQSHSHSGEIIPLMNSLL